MYNILVTGGAGYIGSHTVKELLNQNYQVYVIDDLSNGDRQAVDKRAKFYQFDVYNQQLLSDFLKNHQIDAVLHCAGEIVVSESMNNPYKYFNANVSGMNQVLGVLAEYGIKKIIFSSTASVYGNNCQNEAATEETPVAPVNPYAETKYMGERLIYWMAQRYQWQYMIFRYFNVAGAEMDSSNGLRVKQPTHIIPNINKAALGQIDELFIFGDDYPTKDGSCIRDYIHVLDLAKAHVAGFNYLFSHHKESHIFNLGTEQGYSVIEIFQTAQQILNTPIPYKIVERRAGDPASVLADTHKVQQILGWQPQYTLQDIILSDYQWRLSQGKVLLAN